MSLKTLIGTAVTNAASDENILNKVYDDAIHPSAQNVGQALDTLTSTLNVLLAPFSWAVYGFKHIDAAVKSKLEDKLSDTPVEFLKEPESNIVIPAYEALRYNLDKEQLKNMYINLIANSMKVNNSKYVHPAFVEVIKQLSVFDAELLEKLFKDGTMQIPKIKVRLQRAEFDGAGIDVYNIVIDPKYYSFSLYHDEYTISLENLERLKILTIHDDNKLLIPNLYDNIIGTLDMDYLKNVKSDLPYVKIFYGSISLTKFGEELIKNIF